MGKYATSEELPNLLHKLQFASKEERMGIFEEVIKDEEECSKMKALFSQEARIIRYKDLKSNALNLPEEYMGIYKMGEGLRYITDNEVYFDPKDLHSIETIDNFALRFRTQDGIALGDGGEYTKYAQRWNSKIQSFWSVASGVESIERNSPIREVEEFKRKIALCSIDASPEFVIKVIRELEDIGECTIYKGRIKNVGKAIKKLRDEYSHIAILGKNEENGQEIIIKSITDGETFSIKSPNKAVGREENDYEER